MDARAAGHRHLESEGIIMSQLSQDPTTGDLVFTNNQLTFVDGADQVKQSIIQRFRTFAGEWFLDTSLGIPYFQNVLVKNPNLTLIESYFKNELWAVPGVLSIITFSLNFDPVARTISISCSVQSSAGPIQVEVTI